jgi:ferredoxin
MDTLNDCLALVRKRGTVVAFGVPDHPVYAIEFETFFRKNAHLIAVVTPEWSEYLTQARDLFLAHRDELETLATHRFPIQDAAKAFTLYERHEKASSKLCWMPLVGKPIASRMNLMDTLDHLEKPAEDTYLNCIRCGLCLAVCPTYREYLTETASPRGRVALARKGLEGQLELSPNLIEQMYGCFACMACNEPVRSAFAPPSGADAPRKSNSNRGGSDIP